MRLYMDPLITDNGRQLAIFRAILLLLLPKSTTSVLVSDKVGE